MIVHTLNNREKGHRMMYQLLSTLCNKLVMLFYPPWPSENLEKKILPLFYALFSCNKLFPCFLSNFIQKCNLTYDKFICHHSAVSNCFIKCGISIHPQVCIYNKCILLISQFLKCFWFFASNSHSLLFPVIKFPTTKCCRKIFQVNLFTVSWCRKINSSQFCHFRP